MSNIQIKCPQCKAIMQVDDSDAGWSITCDKCHAKFDVPSAEEMSGQRETKTTAKRGKAPSEHVEPEVYRAIKSMDNPKDSQRARAILEKAIQILTSSEKVKYICVEKPFIPFRKGGAVVLTNRRFMLYRPRFFGRVGFQDYIWRDLESVHLKEGMWRSGTPLKTMKGNIIEPNRLPKIQARKIYSIAQEMEERVGEERRMRKMEESRASAGGVIIHGSIPTLQNPPIQNEDDCVLKLKQLRKMLDEGLISGGEYEAKRQSILSKM